MVRVAVLETNGAYRVEDVAPTLESWQRLVGGLIGFLPAEQLWNPVDKGLLHYIYNDEGETGLQPNLWALVTGFPIPGPLVLLREIRHDERTDLTRRDLDILAAMHEHLHAKLVELGLVAEDVEPTVITWDGDWPGNFRPEQ